MKIIKQSAILEAITPNALEFIERIGRVCYKSEALITSDSSREFIKMLLNPDKKHESVLEHAVATIRFITDRGVTHEIVRHRIASYSQESTRYCNYGKNKFGNELTVILPVRFYKIYLATITGNWEGITEEDRLKFGNWYTGIERCEEHYLRAIEIGEKPQEARDLLLNSLKTEIVMTANFREWRHFFSLRTSQAAHPQMRGLAIMALSLLKKEVEIIFDEY
jgi:thymidylate synthase (FAD)